MAKLNALAVQRANKPGLYGDGDGLYLKVSPTGGKSWVFRFTRKVCGCETSCACDKRKKYRTRDMGLGSYPLISLAAARDARDHEKRKLLKEADPIEARKAERKAREAEEARNKIRNKTFEKYAAEFLESKKSHCGLRRHKQYTGILKRYAFPVFGKKAIHEIDSKMVFQLIQPMWAEKTETAIQLRRLLEECFDWIIENALEDLKNPAVLKGPLKSLPKRSKVNPVKHFAALPFEEIPEFMPKLRAQPGVASLAVEYTILTAVRSGETRGARFEEIDFEKRIWTIPPARMKAGREHQVPLSPRALEILEMRKLEVSKILGPNPTGLVFSSRVGGPPLSDMSLTAVLRRMNCEVNVHGEKRKLTVHGFRSTFRDWCGDRTAFPRDVAEAALAHGIAENKAEAAYRRGTALEKRRKLMEAWGAYCTQPPAMGRVIGINEASAASVVLQ